MMSKSGMQRVADLGQTAKKIYEIIKAGLKGGLQGAAVTAVKAYWPKILVIAAIVILLPAIIVCCLPAILFGWGGSQEQSQVETYQNCYTKYAVYRDEQLEAVKNSQMGVACNIEYLNDPFETSWLIAIDSVNNSNNINNMNEEKLKELIKQTYTYEIVEAEVKKDVSSENPWEDTTHEITDPTAPEQPQNPTKTIKVTTSTPEEVMKLLNFNEENIDWANLIYDTLKSNEYSP